MSSRAACLLWAFALLPPAAARAAGEHDYRFGEILLDHGYFDLAELVFGSIASDTSLPPQDRAKGQFGIARVQVHRALAERDPECRADRSRRAMQEIESFLNQYPDHPEASTANSYLGYLLRENARVLAARAQREPRFLTEARQALDQAIERYRNAIRNLGPEPIEPGPEQERWGEAYPALVHELVATLYTFGEVFEPFPALRDACRDALRQAIQTTDEFGWTYGDDVAALYQLTTYAGRSAWLLARMASGEEAQKWWEQAWRWFNFGIALKDRENLRREMHDLLAEVVVAAALWEARARLAYAESHPAEARDAYNRVVALADSVLALFPDAERDPNGKYLEIERARAYFRSGRADEARRRLDEFVRRNEGTIFEMLALDVLSELAESPDILLRVAEVSIQRRLFADAAQKYRRAISLLPAGDPRRARAWFMAGQCYEQVGLLEEAIACYSQVADAPDFLGDRKTAGEAALRRYNLAGAISSRTRLDEDAARETRWGREGTERFPDVFSDAIRLRNAWRMYREGQYDECIREAERISPESASYRKAQALVGQAYYRKAAARWDEARQIASEANRQQARREALEGYRRALEPLIRFYETTRDDPTAGDRDLQDALTTLARICILLSSRDFADLDPQWRNPRRIIELTEGVLERFEKAALGNLETVELPARVLRYRFFAILETLDPANPQEAIRIARAEREKIEDFYERTREGGEHMRAVLQQGAAVFSRWAASASDPQTRRLYQEETDLWADPTTLPPREAFRYFYARAESTGRAELYRRAREALEAWLASPDAPAQDRERLEFFRARCLRHEGRVDDAVGILQVLAARQQGTDVELSEELADALRAKYDASRASADIEAATDRYGRLVTAIIQSAQYRSGDRSFREAYWRLLYKWVESLSKHKLDEAWNWFARRIHSRETTWDRNEFGYAEKFDELMRQVEQRANRQYPHPSTSDQPPQGPP